MLQKLEFKTKLKYFISDITFNKSYNRVQIEKRNKKGKVLDKFWIAKVGLPKNINIGDELIVLIKKVEKEENGGK